MASGTTPRMKAMDVIMIGRNRSLAASSAGFDKRHARLMPMLANSTIRIAFLAESPMSVTNPIWK